MTPKLASRVIFATFAVALVCSRIPAFAGDDPAGWPEKILFLGNSITRHGPLPAIEWMNDHGMAASAPEKDYVHLLLRRFAEENNGRVPQSIVENIAEFERHYDTMDLAKEFKKYADFKADVVILAIGENVRPLPTKEDQARFKKAVVDLLTLLKRGGTQRILVRNSFWPNTGHDDALRQACADVGGVYVDLGGIGNDESNKAYTEKKFNYLKYAGVGGHPGDKGMAAIAEAIWKSWKSLPR
jgi:alpha-galactosidase